MVWLKPQHHYLVLNLCSSLSILIIYNFAFKVYSQSCLLFYLTSSFHVGYPCAELLSFTKKPKTFFAPFWIFATILSMFLPWIAAKLIFSTYVTNLPYYQTDIPEMKLPMYSVNMLNSGKVEVFINQNVCLPEFFLYITFDLTHWLCSTWETAFAHFSASFCFNFNYNSFSNQL